MANSDGQRIAESLRETDAVADVLTFSRPVEDIEIWHNEATPQTFIVNGITLHIGPGGWARPVAGTPAATVTVPSGVVCAVSRLV